jgi:hypothetical protein
MFYVKKIIFLFSFLVLLQGCLVFNSVSYEVNLTDTSSGTVVMNVSDIRSDAMDASELEKDKDQLFNEMLKSDDFVNQMKEQGKNIISRNLYVSDGKLNGTVKYSFNDITNVENFNYQDPFYFVTLEPTDSIISTNGEVVVSKDHKRIMWDKSMKTLKFEMFSTDVEKGNLVELTKYFKE